jgi:hypothetical protein
MRLPCYPPPGSHEAPLAGREKHHGERHLRVPVVQGAPAGAPHVPDRAHAPSCSAPAPPCPLRQLHPLAGSETRQPCAHAKPVAANEISGDRLHVFHGGATG